MNPVPTNWPLNTYTVSTWTDLVVATVPTAISAITVATGVSAASVKVRLTDGSGVSLAMIIPAAGLASLSGNTFDMRGMALNTGDKLQVQASVAGVEFLAFGAV